MQYRRIYHPGACYFFTLVTHRRYPWFAEPEALEQLRKAIRQEKARRAFAINAFVVMPDHLHAVWTLPDGDSDYSIRWRNIKRAFTASIADSQRPVVSASRQHKNEQGIWQRRFWEHKIRDERDFIQHIDYIHYNPVKHGLVARPVDWPFSSLHRYIRQGVLPANWGESPLILDSGIGWE
ncbi:transposase [Methylomonas koyamae]|uniref:Transposase n=1 Tax=Methylomonas koyamae TaxID=702114 RepID=A0A177NPE6_9GAMM|nr:transposase [Methylomonas koyamae]OAI19845.1 transposase [Methylomonas koyamae]